jgi:predicted porin
MRKILLATAAGFAAMVADGATPARAQSAAEVSGQTPTPGLTGYVQGRFRFYGALVSQDGDSKPAGVVTDATVPAGTGGKLSNFDFFDYGRIWIGADGVAENGLRYGARLEIRMPSDGARGDGRGGLFFRRAVGYIGTPTLGQLRFGSGTVRAVEQMHVGHIMGTIASGLLDGDQNVVFIGQGGLVASSFFYSSSTVNNNSAIGYYTPQFFGFDLGISYAPNDGNLNGICATPTFLPTVGANAGSFVGCDGVSSSTDAATAARLRNQIDVMLRYRGTFGPVGLAASGGFRTADTVDAIAPATGFKRATAGIVGATVTWAGLTVGGITTFGPYNRGFTALPKSGPAVQNRNAFSWQLGARYTIGAITVGAAYHELRTEGATGVGTGKLKERGFGLGASYALAPGLALFAEYLYSKVEESGRDFNVFQAGTQDSFKANIGLLGVSIAW